MLKDFKNKLRRHVKDEPTMHITQEEQQPPERDIWNIIAAGERIQPASVPTNSSLVVDKVVPHRAVFDVWKIIAESEREMRSDTLKNISKAGPTAVCCNLEHEQQGVRSTPMILLSCKHIVHATCINKDEPDTNCPYCFKSLYEEEIIYLHHILIKSVSIELTEIDNKIKEQEDEIRMITNDLTKETRAVQHLENYKNTSKKIIVALDLS